MSRIGRKPIFFSPETEVSLEKDKLKIENKERISLIQIPFFLSIYIKDRNITLEKKNNSKHSKAMFGTKRQEIFNTVTGFEIGFKKTLILYGIGYSLVDKENKILFSLGYSHVVEYIKHPELNYKILSKNSFLINGYNKQLFGQEISKIKSLKKRNVYDCYGIYESTENRIKKEKRKK